MKDTCTSCQKPKEIIMKITATINGKRIEMALCRDCIVKMSKQRA